MADSPDLQRLLQDKHEALHAYRDAVDDEIRATAWIAVDEASKALDAALVDKETARSDNERMAAVEARDAAAKMVGSVEKPPQPAAAPGVWSTVTSRRFIGLYAACFICASGVGIPAGR